jgi:hypothetical protein
MYVHLRAATAANARQQATMGRVLAAAMLATLTSACAATAPSPLAGADPASSSARVPAVKYRSTLGTYTSQRPVEPAPPAEPNGLGAPPPKP